jgi:hypothetical protein
VQTNQFVRKVDLTFTDGIFQFVPPKNGVKVIVGALGLHPDSAFDLRRHLVNNPTPNPIEPNRISNQNPGTPERLSKTKLTGLLQRNKLAIFTMVVLLALLVWAIWTMVQMWNSVEGAMGTHEVIAMWLGIIFSCVVGFGLMALVFYSSREGYDEPPHYILEDDESDDSSDPH